MSNQPLLKLSHISKDYSQGRSVVEVLKDINLEIYKGQTISIVGASGSGKSTLLHIAGLLDSPDHGQIIMNGVPPEDIMNLKNAHKIRLDNMGFVYQHHHLLRDFTAQENAAMPLFIKGVSKSESMEQSAELLEHLGLGKRLK
jgi:lipoprotein-releasing system ATP-binding protein